MIDKETLGEEKVIALILSAIGLIMLLWSSWNNVNPIGIMLALSAALANAFYLIYSPKMLRQVHQLTLIAWLFLASSIFYWAIGILSGTIHFNFTMDGWFYLVGLSLISTAAATLALIYGLPLTGPTHAAIINTLEPPFTALLAYLVFKEVLTGLQILGAGLILIAVLFPHFNSFSKEKIKRMRLRNS